MGGWGELEQVNFFYKESKSKKTCFFLFFFFLFFFFGGGGGGVRGGGGGRGRKVARVSEFFLIRIQIEYKKNYIWGGGGVGRGGLN